MLVLLLLFLILLLLWLCKIPSLMNRLVKRHGLLEIGGVACACVVVAVELPNAVCDFAHAEPCQGASSHQL